MKIRDEEHRELQGLLPSDLARVAVRINVRGRETGIDRAITAEDVRVLGAEGIKAVIDEAGGDPRVARHLVQTRSRRPKERPDRDR
jgi:hypothetical protein